MAKIIECVPNFSEGRNKATLDALKDTINKVEGVTLLDVDPGADTNRTVFTFVGNPDSVIEAAFQAIKTAAELIDMSVHKGAHARQGATDVCPIIPISEVTMGECVEYSKMLADRVGKELDIPVYLYGYSASKSEWRNLANIRKGEYEALQEKLKNPEWKPDFGPSEFTERVKKTGATVIGARDFLIAWNVNLNTTDRKLAHEIALNIRETGRSQRDENGDIVKDKNGKAVTVPGTLKSVKAVGWYIEGYGRTQISMNLENYHITPPHLAVEECKRQAEKFGLIVTGNELVGLVPKEAMLMAGKYYLEKMGKSGGYPERFVIETAVRSLGLNELSHFDIEKKIIEYAIDKKNRKLVNMTITAFADELSSDSPAPGGGSVAALNGAMSAGLISMVCHLTVGKKGYEKNWEELKRMAETAQSYKYRLLDAIDDDTEAFNAIMNARKLPKEERPQAVENATKRATEVPLGVLESCVNILRLAKEVKEKGNINCASDAGTAIANAFAGAMGAYLNVKINAPSLKNMSFSNSLLEKAEKLKNETMDITTWFDS